MNNQSKTLTSSRVIQTTDINKQTINSLPSRSNSKTGSYRQQNNIPSRSNSSRLSNHDNLNNNINQQNKSRSSGNVLTTIINGYNCQFSLSKISQQIMIKCSPVGNQVKVVKKLVCTYRYEKLPKAVQITYRSIQELFQEFKYIIDQNICQQRLKITPQGKFIFNLETKKKGKSQFVPETFQLEEENQERRIQRLEEEIQRLKMENQMKDDRINQFQSRLMKLEQVNKIPYKKPTSSPPSNANDNNNDYTNQQLPANFLKTNRPSSEIDALNTIQTQLRSATDSKFSQTNTQNPSTNSQQSIIKKFKRSKSNQELSLKNIQAQTLKIQQKVLKMTIHDYDCFFQLQNQKLKVQLLSRQQARIYKCTIDVQIIPKSVYSFIPTPTKLYEEIAFIIQNKIPNRLDVVDTNFVYRASINQKKQQVLIDGVFQTHSIMQNDLQRIQDLIDIRTSTLSQDLTLLKLQFGILKKSLQSNGLVLQMPLSFCSNKSKIIQTDSQYITVCKFFPKRIYKIQLLFRASQHSFDIKKFHQKCDGIPNTLTVILTQFGKKIGGFTPLPWDKNGNDKFLTDYQNLSFIFSITNSHKFSLEQNQFAAKVSAQDGPRFGNGADLVLKDKSNQNNNSYANICTSYTHPRYVYKSVESYQNFSGDQKTNRFKTNQWQVYQVFFEE